MPRLTAVEFSDDTCMLVRVATRGTSIAVAAVDRLDPAAFPGVDMFTTALREARRSGRFPRRARVVLWGLPDGADLHDPAVRSRVEPLINAGFRIERVVTPCNALAVLARIRVPKPESATIWLAVNSGGVAIVATRPGELLHTQSFEWDSSMGAVGSQARLLQRYSLVSVLAPQARQAIAAVREAGADIDAIVICGTLPDLRSLTMPLIEELDVEVETLDSLTGLIVQPSMRDRLLELAPAVRLACAGALARPSRPRYPLPVGASQRNWLLLGVPFAALLLLALAAALLAPRWLHTPAQETPLRREAPRSASAPPPPRVAPRVEPSRPSPPVVQSREPDRPVPPQPLPTPPPSPRGARPPLLRPAPRADTSGTGSLKDPLPHVTTIMVAPDRRFAIVDGRIVGIGDRVGQRTVTAIEPRVVVFREPSGVQIRVGLGGRLAADDRKS